MKRTGNCDRLPSRTDAVFIVGEELPGRHAFADAISEILEGSKTHEYRREGSYFVNRRGFLQLLGATGAAALTASCNRINSVTGTLSNPADLVRFPEKAELILLTDRPPQLETPLHYFRQDLTPNEAFFVRWHLEGIPTSVDLQTFRLNIAGHLKTPLSLSFHELATRFPAVSMV